MSPLITTRNSGYLLIFILAISSSFAPLSVDFFAPSMPRVTRDLATSAIAVQSTIYIFFIGYAISPFLWGGLADRFGRRRVMLTGIMIYSLGSLGCFFSSGIFGLSVMRLLQGVGAASGVVIARAVLRDIHGPAGATKAISDMFLVMVWIPIFAPVAGGYLATHFSWRVGFLVMALIAGLVLAGSYLWLMETAPDRPRTDSQKKENWHTVVSHPEFIRHTLANMFCLGTMLLFVSNYSYLSEQHYRLSSAENGYVLAIFNAGLSVGVYLVRLLAPRIGVAACCFCLPGHGHGDQFKRGAGIGTLCLRYGCGIGAFCFCTVRRLLLYQLFCRLEYWWQPHCNHDRIACMFAAGTGQHEIDSTTGNTIKVLEAAVPRYYSNLKEI